MSDGARAATGGIAPQSLAELDAAVSRWHKCREEIAPDDEERLWRKLRLEWNYNSNHIEGNTLTYDETELLIIHDRVAGAHPMRDYEEMKAHDVAIKLVRDLSAAERPLAETDIRELNRVLLKEPFWKRAQTPDGEATRKWIEPGKYKTQPNHVRTRTGEVHRFAEPEETPARMREWVRRFREDLTRTDYALNVGVRAARGLSIADSDDLNKEISLFVQGKRARRPTRSDLEALDEIYRLYVWPTIERLDAQFEELSELFRTYSAMSYVQVGRPQENPLRDSSKRLLEPGPWEEIKEEVIVDSGFTFGDPPIGLRRTYELTDYCGESGEGFSLSVNVEWALGAEARAFRVSVAGRGVPEACHPIPYARLGVDPPEVEARVEIICRAVMEEIDRRSRPNT